MKSSINTLADYHEAPFEREVVLRCPAEYVEKELKHLVRSLKKNEQAEILEKGVVAVLALESALPKFQKPMVPVTIGSGLFDAGLEEQLIGHRVGESFMAEAQGKPVQVTVKQASRTVYPEPTDEMAAAYAAEHEEFEGITTVEEYRQRIIEKYLKDQRDGAFYGAMEDVMNYVLTHSDWEFDDEELAELVEERRKELREELAEEGKDFDKLTEEELKGYFDVSTFEEVGHILTSSAEQYIATALWFGAVYGKDTQSMTMDELLDLGWGFLEDYVKENLNIMEEK